MKINFETKLVFKFCVHLKFLIKTQSKTSACVGGRIFLLFILIHIYIWLALTKATETRSWKKNGSRFLAPACGHVRCCDRIRTANPPSMANCGFLNHKTFAPTAPSPLWRSRFECLQFVLKFYALPWHWRFLIKLNECHAKHLAVHCAQCSHLNELNFCHRRYVIPHIIVQSSLILHNAS